MKTALLLASVLLTGCGGGSLQPQPAKGSPPPTPTCAHQITTPAVCITTYGTISGTIGNASVQEGFGWVISYVGPDGSEEGGSDGEMFPAQGKIVKSGAGAWWNAVFQPNGPGSLPITFNASAPGENYPAMAETIDSPSPNTIAITMTARSCADDCRWYGWFFRVATAQVDNAPENYFSNSGTEATAYLGSSSVSLAGGCTATMPAWISLSAVSNCGEPVAAALETAPGVLFASSAFDMSVNGAPSSAEFVYVF